MTTGVADIRQLSDTELADVWRAGGIDLDQLTAESDRRDREQRAAERAAAKRAAERAAWLDAAHAQYQQASADCAGRLLARGVTLASEFPQLWSLSAPQAWRMASEELRNWWDDHGRLSLAEYRRQQAMGRRADRDARDLAAMPERTTPNARELAREAAASAPRQAPRPPGGIARYLTALGLLERKANATARALARVGGGQ